jgi:hypothetical protein
LDSGQWSSAYGLALNRSDDRLDKDFYFVLADFRDGAAFRETEEGIDHPTLIKDLLNGQYGQVLRVVAFNPVEGWSRDASEDVVLELERRLASEDHDISEALQDFIEGRLGRKSACSCRCP